MLWSEKSSGSLSVFSLALSDNIYGSRKDMSHRLMVATKASMVVRSLKLSNVDLG